MDQKAIGILNIAIDTFSKYTASQIVEFIACADSPIVINNLRDTLFSYWFDGAGNFDHITDG